MAQGQLHWPHAHEGLLVIDGLALQPECGLDWGAFQHAIVEIAVDTVVEAERLGWLAYFSSEARENRLYLLEGMSTLRRAALPSTLRLVGELAEPLAYNSMASAKPLM